MENIENDVKSVTDVSALAPLSFNEFIKLEDEVDLGNLEYEDTKNEQCPERIEYTELEQRNNEIFIVPYKEKQECVFSENTENLEDERYQTKNSKTTNVTAKNEIVTNKTPKEPCNNCFLACSSIFSPKERTQILQQFWSLTSEEKNCFYKTFVFRDKVKRRRKSPESDIKQFTYKYFLEKNQSLYRVCRIFFLNTLCIDQKRIYYSFKHSKHNDTCSAQRVSTSAIKASESSYCRTSVPSVKESFSTRKSKKPSSLWKINFRTHNNVSKRAYASTKSKLDSTRSEDYAELGKLEYEDTKNDQCTETIEHIELGQNSNEIFILPHEEQQECVFSGNTDIMEDEMNQTKKSKTAYVAAKNEIVTNKTLKEPCSNCFLACSGIFSPKERTQILQQFWSLTSEEKNCFYKTFVLRDKVKRRRKSPESDIKQFTYKYFFEKNQSLYRVCRIFFLNTLCIDQKRIYYSFKHSKNNDTFSAQRVSTSPKKDFEISEKILNLPAVCSYRRTSVPLAKESFSTQKRKKIGKIKSRTQNNEYKRAYSSTKMEVGSSLAPLSFNELIKSDNTYSEDYVKLGKLEYEDTKNDQCPERIEYIELGQNNSEELQECVFSGNTNIMNNERNQTKKSTAKNKVITYKTPKEPCNNCSLACSGIFSPKERTQILQQFWNLTSEEKNCFYKTFVLRDKVKRRRKSSESDIKQFTYKYFFEKNQSLYRVCRIFFLNTLCIDQKRIYYSFKHSKTNDTLSAQCVSTSPEKAYEIPEHTINLPAVSSYCRASVPSAKELIATRKRKKTSSLKIKFRMQNNESKRAYASTKREVVPGRELREPCNNCSYECTNKFTAKDRTNIFQSFWSLSADERNSFYNKFVIRENVKRREKHSKSDIKQFSYKYFLEKKRTLHRVCRVFFLNTLSIDQKRIYYSFKHLRNEDSLSSN